MLAGSKQMMCTFLPCKQTNVMILVCMHSENVLAGSKQMILVHIPVIMSVQ